MWQRFTERARRTVFYAQEEAGNVGENKVSTEHLLLGLLRERDHVAARVLMRIGISLDDLHEEAHRQVIPGGEQAGKDMELAPRAKRVIDLAYDEARHLDNNYIGTEHLLLGLIREGQGIGGKALEAAGATLERVRAETLQIQVESRATKGGKTEEAGEGELSSLKENLHRVAEALKNRAQGLRENAEETRNAMGTTGIGSQRGDIGVLKAGDERALVEFVPSDSALAAFEDVMRIKDEYAYRELVTTGKILLVETGTQAKFLKRGSGETDYVRILSGRLAGELGYVLRATLQELKPDDRPFPPALQE